MKIAISMVLVTLAPTAGCALLGKPSKPAGTQAHVDFVPASFRIVDGTGGDALVFVFNDEHVREFGHELPHWVLDGPGVHEQRDDSYINQYSGVGRFEGWKRDWAAGQYTLKVVQDGAVSGSYTFEVGTIPRVDGGRAPAIVSTSPGGVMMDNCAQTHVVLTAMKAKVSITSLWMRDGVVLGSPSTSVGKIWNLYQLGALSGYHLAGACAGKSDDLRGATMFTFADGGRLLAAIDYAASPGRWSAAPAAHPTKTQIEAARAVAAVEAKKPQNGELGIEHANAEVLVCALAESAPARKAYIALTNAQRERGASIGDYVVADDALTNKKLTKEARAELARKQNDAVSDAEISGSDEARAQSRLRPIVKNYRPGCFARLGAPMPPVFE